MSQLQKPYYSLEFKQDAAQLIISKGYSYQDAAASLGISISALRKWVKAEQGQDKSDSDLSPSKLSLSEREELLRLRKENARLKMEREILKKASAFFAQEMK
jgi:transposase